MSRGRKQSTLRNWHLILVVTIACVTGGSPVPAATAQKSESPTVMASLSVSTIQMEFILDGVRERPDRPLPVLHGKPTDAEAWGKFEVEYEPQHPSLSPIKRQIETVKFGLDTTVFAVDRFVKSIRDHADFELDKGSLRRTQTNYRGASLDKPRVKLDLEVLRGKPYAGVRVVIPFGN